MRYGKVDEKLEADTNRFMVAGAGILIAMAAIFPFYRWFEPTSRADARVEHLDSMARTGEQMWNVNCASCHGLAGEGVSAPALNSKQFLQSAGDDQIATFIAVGVPGTEMSAYSQDFSGPLTSEQIRAITIFLRSWEEDAPDREDWRAPYDQTAAAD